MLLFVNRTYYTFCSKLILKIQFIALRLLKIGTWSLFSISVDKVRLRYFFIA